MIIRAFQPEDEKEVVQLWIECKLVVPHNNPARDIARKLAVNPEWFLVGELNGKVVASCMAGYEGHRGWINYLAVSPSCQRRGYAREMMQRAEELLTGAGCPKINLQIRTANQGVVEFYRNIGFRFDEVVSMGKPLLPDAPFGPASRATKPLDQPCAEHGTRKVIATISRTRYVIAVPDLEASSAYYRDVLGFSICSISDPGWLIYQLGACTIMAGRCPDAMHPSTLGDHSCFAHVEMEDVDSYYNFVQAKGASIRTALRDEAWGMREFGLQTSDGHRIMFASPIRT